MSNPRNRAPGASVGLGSDFGGRLRPISRSIRASCSCWSRRQGKPTPWRSLRTRWRGRAWSQAAREASRDSHRRWWSCARPDLPSAACLASCRCPAPPRNLTLPRRLPTTCSTTCSRGDPRRTDDRTARRLRRALRATLVDRVDGAARPRHLARLGCLKERAVSANPEEREAALNAPKAR
jgi:hypothetical protein